MIPLDILPYVIVHTILQPNMKTPCWECTKRINRNGYARLGTRVAHRVIYERLVGPIPKGLILDHLCRFRPCIRPDHLEPVTHAVNTHRGLAVLFKKAA